MLIIKSSNYKCLIYQKLNNYLILELKNELKCGVWPGLWAYGSLY